MKWFLGILLLLLVSLVLNAGLLAYAAYVLLGLLLLSRVLARSWSNNLVAQRSCKVAGERSPAEDEKKNLTAEVGQRVTIRVVVRNTGWGPVPWVLVEDLLPRYALERRHPWLRVKGKRLHLGMVRGG